MPIDHLPCRAVLFDSDGVLVDSDASVTRAWRRWADAYGLDPDEVLSVTHGRRASDTVTELIDAAEREQAVARINQLELDDAAAVTALPGARQLIGSVPEGRRAVVTSGSVALATARLQQAGIEVPVVLVTGDDVEQGKPAPDGYLRAARALGFEPADVVVVEDSTAGVESARSAGVGAVVGVGIAALQTDADVVVDDLRLLSWAGSGLSVAHDPVTRHR